MSGYLVNSPRLVTNEGIELLHAGTQLTVSHHLKFNMLKLHFEHTLDALKTPQQQAAGTAEAAKNQH